MLNTRRNVYLTNTMILQYVHLPMPSAFRLGVFCAPSTRHKPMASAPALDVKCLNLTISRVAVTLYILVYVIYNYS